MLEVWNDRGIWNVGLNNICQNSGAGKENYFMVGHNILEIFVNVGI